MADIPFTKPDGSKVWVPEASKGAALQAGYREGDLPEEAGQPVRAGLEATARAATFGISDPFLVGFGTPKEGLKRRQEENPKASFVGTAAGILAPGGLPGKISGAVAKLGARSLGVKLLAAGAEGTLYGLQDMISEQAMGDPNINGERVAASMVAPALAGAVLTGVTHGLGKGASKLLKNLGGTAVSGELEKLAGSARQKVLRAQAIDKKALAEYGFEGRADDAIDWADRKGVFAGSSHESVAELAGREVQKAGADLEDIESTLQRISPPDLPSLVSALRQRAGSMSNTVTGEKQAGLLHDLANAFEARMKVAPDGAPVHGFEPRARSSAYYDFPANVPESLRDDRLFGGVVIPGEKGGQVTHGFSWTDLRAELARLSEEAGPIDSKGRKGVLKEARSVIRDEVESQMRSVAPALGDAWERSFTELGYGLSIAKSATRRAAQGLKPLSDEIGGLAGALAFSGAGSVPGLIAGRAVQKFAQQRGGYLLADALKHVADSKILTKMATALETTVADKLATMPAMLGPYRRALEAAAARGTGDLFATHLALASSENGEDYLARMGIEKGDPAMTQAYGKKLAVLSAINTDDSTTKAASRFFSSAAPIAGVKQKRSPEAMMEQVKNIDFLLSGPNGVAEIVDPDLITNAPGTGANAIMTLDRAMRALQSAAPRDPQALMPPSLKRSWKPSPSEMDRWYDTLEAIQDPASIFDRMKVGEVPSASVQAVKMTYPQMFEAVRQQMADRIVESRKPVTYKQRLGLASVFGPEFLGISAMQAQILQQVHKKSVQPADEPPASPDGRQMVDQEKNMETQAQRIERR